MNNSQEEIMIFFMSWVLKNWDPIYESGFFPDGDGIVGVKKEYRGCFKKNNVGMYTPSKKRDIESLLKEFKETNSKEIQEIVRRNNLDEIINEKIT